MFYVDNTNDPVLFLEVLTFKHFVTRTSTINLLESYSLQLNKLQNSI